MNLSVSADSLSHLFEEAAREYVEQMLEPQEIGEALQEKLVIEAEDIASLFRSWLGGLFSLIKDQHILPKRIILRQLDMAAGKPYSVRADIIGELLDPHRHTLKQSLDGLKIRETSVQSQGDGWSAQISI